MTKSGKERLLLSVAVLPTVYVIFLVYLSVPTFISMYSEYQGALPIQTDIVFSFYRLVVILPFFVIAAWFFMRRFKYGSMVTILFGVAGSLFVAAVVKWAVYQPEIIITLIDKSYE
jgi:type II secretory pathway component PulF